MDNKYKVLAINGSHRSEKGFTEIVLSSFLNGVKSSNASYEVLYPAKQNIITCESCGKCLFETPGVCKFDDDMKSVVTKMDQADLLVFASPVYFDSMTSNMKKMIERLRSTLDAFFEFRDGRTHHIRRSGKDQRVVLIFTAGNPEKESFVSISRIFRRIIDNMGWRLEGELRFPASHLLATDPGLMVNQIEAVTMCGKEAVLKGSISENLLKAANKEYIENPESTLRHMTRTILDMRKAKGNCA